MRLKLKEINAIIEDTERKKSLAFARVLSKIGDPYADKYLDEYYEEEYFDKLYREAHTDENWGDQI